MTEPSLIAELRALDIQVWAADDDLQLDAPAGALTPELRERLREHKNAILEFLRGPAELSFSQQRLWFLDQIDPGGAAYVIEKAIGLQGALDPSALEAALEAVVNRHESLRTVFVSLDGRPQQTATRPGPWKLPVVDLSVETDARSRLAQLLREESARGFDLASGPLFRAVLYRVAAGEHVLLLLLHHIISDALSMSVMLRELGVFYRDRVGGREPALPELPMQYRDFARWQRGRLQGEVLARQVEFWRSHLADAPLVIDLPTDRPRPPVESHRGAPYSFALSREVSQGLGELARREGVTRFMVLLAALNVLLWRYTGQDDLLVGTPVANRDRTELEGLVGLFVNTLVLRSDLSGNPTVQELLARVRQRTLEALAHRELPFDILVESLRAERDLSRNPIFQVMLVLQSIAPQAFVAPGLDVLPVGVDRGAAQLDLALYLQETTEGLKGTFEYATDLFEPKTIERMAGHWRTLLEAMIASPGSHLSDLPLLSDDERHQLQVDFNATDQEYPRATLMHGLFEAQAARLPGRTALRAGAEALSYADLDARATRIARALRARGAGRGQRVGLCVERGADMLAAVLGILKTGAAYVPLDPSFPQQRLGFIAADAELSLLVSTAAHAGSFSVPAQCQLLLDTDAAAIAAQPDRRLDPDAALDARPEDPAYVIYTSGSTGQPKGVVVPHRAVVNFLASMAREPGLAADDVLVAVTTLSFDIAVLELQLPLSVGATVVIASRDEALSGQTLKVLLERHRATVMQATPVTWRLLLDAGWTGPRAFKVLVGGEALPADLAERLIATGAEVWNMYGPTETTVWSTCARIPDTANGITIGKPIANTTAHVLDARQRPCPIGVPGELYLGGDGVALGYWNRPELTAERFIPDPFSAVPGATLYRTGDRARWRMDGTLEHLGRLDFQIKLRGFRIEPGEIENTIARHPAIRDVVVVVREDVPGDQRLVAYLITGDPAEDLVDQLRTSIRTVMPDYMVPGHFIVLDTLPRTQNGKLDRKALPAPDRSHATQRRTVAPPRTETETTLAAIWIEVLGLDAVGIDENFFDLGGHSLLTMQVVSRVRQALLVELPLRAFFTMPTIAALAAHLDALRAEVGAGAGRPIDDPATALAFDPHQGRIPSYPAGPAELSFAQQRLWFLDQIDPDGAAYVLASGIELSGALDLSALEDSLQALVKRHDSLRTVVVGLDGPPRQIVTEPGAWTLSVVDLAGEATARHRLAQLIREETTRGFDLARGPLFRAVLYRLAPDQHVLQLLQHHIISDAWSMAVMWRELGILYRDRVGGRASELPELSVRYQDFSRWQRSRLRGEARARQVEYWSSHLAGAPQVVELPTDRPRPAVESHRGAVHSFTVSLEMSRGVGELARQAGTTRFMVMLAALNVLLWRHTGQEDLLVGTPVANRDRTELEGLIGLFVNMLVLRTDLSGNPTVQELLVRVRERCVDAFAHQELPFDILVEQLKPERDLSRNPIFQVMLVLQNIPQQPFAAPGLTVLPVDVGRGSSQLDLTLYLQDTAEGMQGTFEYATDLFDASTIERMAGHWRSLLGAMLASPGSRLSDLPLLSEGERQQLQVEFNTTAQEYPRATLMQGLFEAQATRLPARTAIRAGGKALSYADLDGRANRLAQALRKRGVGRGQRIGLCVERGADMLVAVLGILKTGAAYVPLDPSFPEQRRRFIAEDAQLALLVTTAALARSAGVLHEHQLLLDSDATAIAAQPAGRLSPDAALDARPEDPAYVIYTSGSTGQPKGVVVPHRAVVNFLTSMAREPGLVADDVLVAVTTLSFDIAVLELQLPLTVGATVVIAARDDAADGRTLGALLEQHHATVMQATPATWRLLLDAGWTGQPSFKALVGGEALPRDVADRLIGNGVELWNMYGPTETTVWSTCVRVSDTSGGITIGKPIANTTVYVLDAQNNICPIGVPGELCIGGDGVALGYWNRPELTAERFIPDVFSTAPGAVLYRTGDRARWRRDGTLEHLGRLDFQIKLRGFRIEPGEIEAVLSEHDRIAQCAVAVRRFGPFDERLVAYVCGTGRDMPTNTELRKFLRGALPDYMIPQIFVELDRLPVTPNGKIDRSALPSPIAATRPAAEPPRTPAEQLIAEAWREMLQVGEVSIRDNFFDLGGHSLLSVEFVQRIWRKTGHRFEVRQLLMETLEQLASRLKLDAALA